MKTPWIKRPDLNWCYNCWFAADIESSINDFGIERFLCRNCNILVCVYPNQDKPEYAPRYFLDEDWNKYWEENYRAKDK